MSNNLTQQNATLTSWHHACGTIYKH